MHAPVAEHVGLHVRTSVDHLVSCIGERRHVDLAIVMAGIREQHAVLEQLERVCADYLREPSGRDHDVGGRQRIRERRDAEAVHVRRQSADGIELDDRDAPAEPGRRARDALPDPAVADDAELAAGGEHVGERKQRGQRRLPGPVRVVEHVLATRVVRRDRRERQQAVLLERTQARDARRRLFAHARELRVELRPVLRHPPRQLRAVVDHELGAALRDREQVGGELLLRHAVARMHLDAFLDERRADGVLRRERVGPCGDHVRTRGAQREHEAGGLRLEVDDHRDAASVERPVLQPLLEQAVEHRHVLPRPVDAPPPFGRERRIGDAGHR